MKLFISILILFTSSVTLAHEFNYEKDRNARWYNSHFEAVVNRLEANHVSTDGLEMYAIIDDRSSLEKATGWIASISKFPYYVRIEEGGMVLRCKLKVLTELNKPNKIQEVSMGLCKIQMLN